MKTRQISVLSVFAAFACLMASAATPEPVTVSSVSELISAIADATAGQEIIIAKGTYDLSAQPCMSCVGHLYTTKKITLRGATGNPADVILHGSNTNRIFYSNKDSARCTVRDITFENGNSLGNVVQTSSEPQETQEGGALCFRADRDQAVVSNCVFRNNTGRSGGAASTYYSVGPNKARYAGIFIDCVFSNNFSTLRGGALNAPYVVRKCRFEKNTSDSYSGAIATPYTVEDCEFIENKSLNSIRYGGAMYVADVPSTQPVRILDSRFTGNTAAGDSGAIRVSTDCLDVLISNCTFTANKALNASTYGGAVGYASNVVECTFIGNEAAYGGGVGMCWVTNSYFYGNKAGSGGASASSTLVDCFCLTNAATTSSGGVAYGGELIDCVCLTNQAVTFGGVMRDGVARGTKMIGNSAASGGALRNVYAEKCEIRDNSCINYGGGAYQSVLVGCQVLTNSSVWHGGGLMGGCATNTVFVGNAATNSTACLGGALYMVSNAVNCVIRENIGFSGAGCSACVAESCLFRGNVTSFSPNGKGVLTEGTCSAAYASSLFNCTNINNRTTGNQVTELHYSYAKGCVFRHDDEPPLATGQNIFRYSNLENCRVENIRSGFYLFGYSTTATNCLVTGCDSVYLLYNPCAGAELVNCSIISNSYSLSAGGSTRFAEVMKNCLFWGNCQSDNKTRLYDFSYASANKAICSMSNCVFAMYEEVPGQTSYTGIVNNCFNTYTGDVFKVGFVGADRDPVNPYAILPRSDAVRKSAASAVEPWMQTATDIRGEGYPRLRDGKVHIGCYECWSNLTGLQLILR